MAIKINSAERVSQEPSDNFVFQRSLLAYHYAATRCEGELLEIGTGAGYGVEIIAPSVRRFISIDKCSPAIESADNVTLISATVPPIPFENESFDRVVSFQVIEHIKEDQAFVNEVFRVLKPGGEFIVSTPNAPMSLTRNPWHIREYNAEEFTSLLAPYFSKIEIFGVNGNNKVMEYYEKNRAGVERITRLDILDLQHRLPAWMLQIPYDILNRINRRRLLSENRDLTQGITMEDYTISELSAHSFDLLCVATK